MHAFSPNEAWFSTTNEIAIQWFDGSAREVEAQIDVHGITDDGAHIIFSGYWTAMVGYITTVDAGHPYSQGDMLADSEFTPSCGFLSVWQAGTKTYAGGSEGCLMVSPDWQRFDPPPEFNSFAVLAGAGTATDDFWVAGGDGTSGKLRHYTAGSWQDVIAPNNGLAAIAITPAGDVWAAGVNGLLVHVAPGGTVTYPNVDTNIAWNGAYAVGPQDVMFVGDNETKPNHGAVGRWTGDDGAIQITYPTASGLNAVHGTSANDIWAGDLTGGIWHYAPP